MPSLCYIPVLSVSIPIHIENYSQKRKKGNFVLLFDNTYKDERFDPLRRIVGKWIKMPGFVGYSNTHETEVYTMNFCSQTIGGMFRLFSNQIQTALTRRFYFYVSTPRTRKLILSIKVPDDTNEGVFWNWRWFCALMKTRRRSIQCSLDFFRAPMMGYFAGLLPRFVLSHRIKYSRDACIHWCIGWLYKVYLNHILWWL